MERAERASLWIFAIGLGVAVLSSAGPAAFPYAPKMLWQLLFVIGALVTLIFGAILVYEYRYLFKSKRTIPITTSTLCALLLAGSCIWLLKISNNPAEPTTPSIISVSGSDNAANVVPPASEKAVTAAPLDPEKAINGAPELNLGSVIRVECASVKRAIGADIKQLYFIQIFDPMAITGDDFSWTQAFFPPGSRKFEFRDDYSVSLSRCAISNESGRDLLRVRISFVLTSYETIKELTGNRSGDALKKVKVSSPEFDLGSSAEYQSYFYVRNLSTYFTSLTAEGPGFAYLPKNPSQIGVTIVPNPIEYRTVAMAPEVYVGRGPFCVSTS